MEAYRYKGGLAAETENDRWIDSWVRYMNGWIDRYLDLEQDR